MIRSTVATSLLLNTWLTLVASEVVSYHLSPDELRAFIGVKQVQDPSYQPFFNPTRRPQHFSGPATNFSADVTDGARVFDGRWLSSGNTKLDCIDWDGYQESTKKYLFSWNSAECIAPLPRPDFHLKCNANFTIMRKGIPKTWRSEPFLFHYVCPHPKLCVDIDPEIKLPITFSGFELKDIACRPPETVVVKQHAAVALKGAGSSADDSEPDWCSLPEIVPGLDYPSSWRTTSFLLTEEVSWANGSFYKAPKLYIRDSPEHYRSGFDRGYKTDTNLVSTIINVGSSRGKLQSKAVNFCMEMIRGGSVWTVMMYTWFKYIPRRGAVPAQIEYVQNSVESEE